MLFGSRAVDGEAKPLAQNEATPYSKVGKMEGVRRGVGGGVKKGRGI